MKEKDINEIAEDLRLVISRIVKILKNEVRHENLLSLTERSTLASIYRSTLIYKTNGILSAELASLEKVTTQSMSQIINKLLKNGFIIKTPSTEDKRKVFITITEKGRVLIEDKKNASQEWLAKSISEKITQKETEILVEAINVMTKLVDSK